MIYLVKVTIANKLDDNTHCEVLAYDENDLNVHNNIEAMADTYIKLDDYSMEFITHIERIKPKNISSDAQSSKIVDSIFNK